MAILVVASLIGCQSTAKVTGGKKRPDRVETAVSLSPSTSEFLTMGNVFPGLLGRTSACDYPPGILSAPIVVNGGVIDYEKIKAANPDLVIYDKDLYSASEIAKIEELGFKTFAYGPKTLEEYEQDAVELSQMVGTEAAASQMIDKIKSAIESGRAGTPPDTVSISVVMGGGTSEYMVEGINSFHGDIFRKMNLTMLGPDAGIFTTVNAEQLLQWNPDIIFAPGKDAETIMKDSRLSSLNAIKNQRVFSINPGILLRAGIQVDQLVLALEVQSNRVAVAKAGGSN